MKSLSAGEMQKQIDKFKTIYETSWLCFFFIAFIVLGAIEFINKIKTLKYIAGAIILVILFFLIKSIIYKRLYKKLRFKYDKKYSPTEHDLKYNVPTLHEVNDKIRWRNYVEENGLGEYHDFSDIEGYPDEPIGEVGEDIELEKPQIDTKFHDIDA